MEPPTSVPTPNVLPRKADNEPSPPLLPPLVRWLTIGPNVWPKTLLSHSATIMDCGTLVFAMTTAPAFSHRVISGVVVVEGSKHLDM
jgi:hypothetical protein